MSAQQIADEGQDHEQGLGGCRQGQAGQALGEGSHQVGGEMAGQEGHVRPHTPHTSPFLACLQPHGGRLGSGGTGSPGAMTEAGDPAPAGHSRGGQEEVSQVEEACPVLDVEDGWVQKAVELPVEVGILPAGVGASEGMGRIREQKVG